MVNLVGRAVLFSALVTACLSVESLKFLIIGDMGGWPIEPYSTLIERSTAEEMGKMADTYSPSFIMEVGDNFYFDGVKDVYDKRFENTFESVYTAKSLQVPWYLIAGNHDHNGNVSAQILYSDHSKRWNFPDFYYVKDFSLGNEGHSVRILFIDTVLLCGNSDDREDSQPHGPEDTNVAKDQLAFIEQALANSKSDYLFVAGHYPVYSIAEHGPTDCLIKDLQPMLETYQVNAYFSGHDHNLQHLQVKAKGGNTINYFVSGMANFINSSKRHEKRVPAKSLKFHNADKKAKGGFLYAESTKSNTTFTFISSIGKQLYTTVVFPRKL